MFIAVVYPGLVFLNFRGRSRLETKSVPATLEDHPDADLYNMQIPAGTHGVAITPQMARGDFIRRCMVGCVLFG